MKMDNFRALVTTVGAWSDKSGTIIMFLDAQRRTLSV